MSRVDETAVLIHSALDSVSFALHCYLKKQRNINEEPSSIRSSLLQNENYVNDQNKDKWKPRYLNKKLFDVQKRFKRGYYSATSATYTFQIVLKKLDANANLDEEEEYVLGDREQCYYVDKKEVAGKEVYFVCRENSKTNKLVKINASRIGIELLQVSTVRV